VKQTVLQTAQQRIPHTYQRSGIYYFCYRVPKVIRDVYSFPSILRQSLQTRSASKASAMVNSFVAQFDEIKVNCVAKKIQKGIKQGLINHSTIFGPKTWDYGPDKIDLERQDAKEFREQNPKLYDPDYAILLAEAKAKVVSHTQEAQEEEPSILLSEAIERCWKWLEERTAPSAKKSGMTDEISRQTRNSFDYLLELIGDKPIASVTKKDIENALEIAIDLPLGNKAPYNNMSATERAKFAKNGDTPEDDMIGSKSHRNIYIDWHKLFSTFLVKKGALSSSPTIGLKPRFESKSFKKFEPHQAGQIRDLVIQKLKHNQLELSQAASKANKDKYQKRVDYCWLILFALYSGARKGDLLGLDVSSFRVDSEEGTGINYVFVEEGKTTAATRRIPIHSRLLELGLLNYVQKFKIDNNKEIDKYQRGETKKKPLVFKSFAKADNVTNYFHESLSELSIPKVHVETGKRYSFHSLRGTFIQNTIHNEKLKTEVVQRVVGHELNAIGITKKYIDDFPLKALSKVIESVEW
jgi:integrase